MTKCPVDVCSPTWQRARMGVRILFGIIALGLLVVAWSAWHGGLAVVTIGAVVLAGWMGWMAFNGLVRR